MRIMFLKLEFGRNSMGLVNCEALGAQALTCEALTSVGVSKQ